MFFSSIEGLILRAVETIRDEDSRQIMAILDESRNMLRSSYDDFKHDQEEYRKQLEVVTMSKEAAMQRRKGTEFVFLRFLRLLSLKKMPFHCRCLCDKNVISKVLLIFVRILV